MELTSNKLQAVDANRLYLSSHPDKFWALSPKGMFRYLWARTLQTPKSLVASGFQFIFDWRKREWKEKIITKIIHNYQTSEIERISLLLFLFRKSHGTGLPVITPCYATQSYFSFLLLLLLSSLQIHAGVLHHLQNCKYEWCMPQS